MRCTAFAYSILTSICIIGCSDSINSHSVNSDSIAPMPSIAATTHGFTKINAATMTNEHLSPFKSVIDTLNFAGDNLVHSDYFLYDITCDGQPDLWVISGTCEADKDLWVFSVSNDTIRKILSYYGGHTELFLKDKTIGSLTCNTGSGYVSVYSYNGSEILVESIEYDSWNNKGSVKIKTAKDSGIADAWESSDSTISLKPLK